MIENYIYSQVYIPMVKATAKKYGLKIPDEKTRRSEIMNVRQVRHKHHNNSTPCTAWTIGLNYEGYLECFNCGGTNKSSEEVKL